MDSERVLVTGGFGLIGFEIVRKLASKGYEVTVTDDLSMQSSNSKYKTNEKLPKDTEFIRIGTHSKSYVEKLSDHDFVYIFNFGSYSTDRYFEANPIDAINKTVNGMINVLKIANRCNSKKVIYPSSGTIYGNQKAPQTEILIPTPQTLYSATKVYLEMINSIYKGINTTAMRIFTGFGAREIIKGKMASVVTLFTVSAIEGTPIDIYGDGSQKRDFIEAKDIAEIGYKLAISEATPSIVNVGSGVSYSFNDLVSLIEKHLNIEIKKNYVKSKTRFVEETRADVEELRKSVGFVPVGLEKRFPSYLEELTEIMEGRNQS